MPTKKEIVEFYEREYPILYHSIHIEDSILKASEVLLVFKKMKLKGIYEIVELGCGVGGLSKELEGTKYHFIVGCDVSDSILRIAKYVNPNLALVKADAEEVPFKNRSADIVLMVDLIEHLKNPWKAIAEAARITKRWIVVRVSIQDCLYHKLRKDKKTWVSDWKLHFGHLWKFNLSHIENILEKKGFRVVGTYLSKPPLLPIKGHFKRWEQVAEFVFTRLLPSSIYPILFPGEYLILGELS